MAISIGASFLVATSIAIVGAAQSAPEQEDQRSVLDGVYKSTQADRGEQTFKKICSACHTLTDVTGGKFREKWADQAVGDIFDYLTNAMPQADPGSLKPAEYTDVLAFFLSRSGYPAGDEELPADEAKLLKIRIEALPK